MKTQGNKSCLSHLLRSVGGGESDDTEAVAAIMVGGSHFALPVLTGSSLNTEWEGQK